MHSSATRRRHLACWPGLVLLLAACAKVTTENPIGIAMGAGADAAIESAGITLIKGDPMLKRLPVMIVSYKDRDEDRRRGLDAGADYYLAKSSFHDETFIHTIIDLAGEPEA